MTVDQDQRADVTPLAGQSSRTLPGAPPASEGAPSPPAGTHGREDPADFALEVVRASREFGGVVKALDDVTVRARRGEFLTILGESGSGKTTLLRIIAGLDHPTMVAALRIGGKDVLGRPPHKRNVTTVFQHFALFPHMSVGENIEYGLKLRGIDARTRRKRALRMLETVRLPGKHDRRIHQLSGGERQRVALARSIVTEPDILLLDEPLGSLDESLRLEMQIELVELQRRLGMTFVYITHSQEEALTMSDRVVLMSRGRIAQEGPPQELFERPCSSFVGRFMGVENVLAGTVESIAPGRIGIAVDGHRLAGAWTGAQPPSPGQRVSLMVRAEKVRLFGEKPPPGGMALRGRVLTSVYKGKYTDNIVETPIGTIQARLWDQDRNVSGEVFVAWNEANATMAPETAGQGRPKLNM
ncbi:MAG: ABC transporter ATP-binding protein [Parvibaculaceae bacterium]